MTSAVLSDFFKWYGAEEFTIGLEELFASVVANSLLYVTPSAHSRFLSLRQAIFVFVAKYRTQQILSLVSCDQKQISNLLDRKTQSLAIKIVSLKLPHTADFLD